MDPLAITADTTRARTRGTVKGLAWKLLYGNHRPTLGPERWDQLVDAVEGPARIKGLGLDEELPIGPFAHALERLAAGTGSDDGQRLEGIGYTFVERWATMYQRLTEHLEQRPARMLEVACEEVLPWFFGDAGAAKVLALDERSATVSVDAALPDAFLAGMLAGFVEIVGPQADVETTGDARFRVTWTGGEPGRPSWVPLVLEATRARMLPATLAPVLVGAALAALVGGFDGATFGLALAGAVCLHLAFNLLNDVLDHRRGVDEANLTPTPFAGGSRVIQRGLLGSDAMLGLAGLLGLAGTSIGAWFVFQVGWPVLALGAAGVGLGYAYSGAPFRLADRGLGEVTAALVFGPLLTAGAFAVQTGTVTTDALLAGTPVGLFMGAFVMVNELPDARWDARTGRTTLAVRLGEHASLGAGLALLSPYPVLAGLVGAGILPWPSLIALATLPFALLVGHRVRKAGTDADAIARLQGFSLLLHATTSALVAGGIAWGVLA